MARVGRLVLTGRTAERFLAVGSDLDGCDLTGGGGFFSKGWATAGFECSGGGLPESSPEARTADGNRSEVGRLDAGG